MPFKERRRRGDPFEKVPGQWVTKVDVNDFGALWARHNELTPIVLGNDKLLEALLAGKKNEDLSQDEMAAWEKLREWVWIGIELNARRHPESRGQSTQRSASQVSPEQLDKYAKESGLHLTVEVMRELLEIKEGKKG